MENFREYIESHENISEKDWGLVVESVHSSRYSVDVNFRTNIPDVMNGFAKIVLSYISASMKQNDFHVKKVFETNPLRVIVSTRNWDDGEWVVMVHYHPDHDGGSFILSKGFYNKGKSTVSVQNSSKTQDSAIQISNEVLKVLRSLKDKPDRRIENMKSVKLKTGPKR